MKNLLSLAILLLFTTFLFSQSLSDLHQLDHQRIKTNQTGMTVLGSWALGNMATFGILRGNATGEQRHFYDFNIGWNVVNLGLATAAYFGARKELRTDRDPATILQKQQSIEKILLFNAGLDVGYVAAGFWMQAAADDYDNPTQWKGYGKGLIMQGTFLFLFDATMYFIHHQNHQQMLQWMNRIDFNGAGFSYRF